MIKMLTISVSVCVVVCVWIIEDTRKTEPAAVTIAEAPAVEDQPQPPIPGVPDPFRPFLDALMQVESGGDCQAVGDNGRSHGPYQISLAYWKDGNYGHTWGYTTEVDNPSDCEVTMFNYWNRYCRKALSELDFETLARVHVGGPRGAMKECTLPYWKKVQKELAKQRAKR